MSTDTTSTHSAVDADDHEAYQQEHPSELVYVKVALFLAVVTGLEVSTYFIFEDPWTAVNVIGLMLMMVIKFATVGAYFMHLKYDHPLFRRVFVAGLILAVVVYVIVFLAFEFFTDDYFRHVGDDTPR